MPILFAVALAAAAVPAPGTVKTFRDWTVACDNIRSCSAASLLPYSGKGDGFQPVTLKRTGAASAPVVLEASIGEGRNGRVELFLDGSMLQALGTAADGVVSGPLSLATLRRMANGARLEMRISGEHAATISLAGFSAAMRYWDGQQRRDGATDAIVARAWSNRAISPPIAPRIVAARLPPGDVAALSPAVIGMLAKRFSCEDEQDGSMAPEVMRLNAKSIFILLPCGSGAYNFSSKPVIATGAGKTATYRLAAFDFAPVWGKGDEPTLVNAEFDPRTATLTSYAKGRGIGDCGTSQTWVWDGMRFRLTEMFEMTECRGATDWMRTWTATVMR